MRFILPIFLITLVIFSIFTYAFVDFNLSYTKLLYTGLYLSHRTFLTSAYVILILVLFACSYYLMTHAEEVMPRFKKIVIYVFIISLFSYPAALSFDIFNYITTARLTFLYHENPYIIYPLEITNDPYLAFTRATNKTALYGPVWIILTALPYFAGLGNFLLTLFSFKLFIGVFYLGTIYVIRKFNKNAAWFFALNPLVIIEVLVGGHNDIVMIFFALISMYLFFEKKYFASIASITGSIFIKPVTLFLVPIYFAMTKDALFKKKIEQNKIFVYSSMFMFVIFLFSPLREELYPWYAVWFIAFTCFRYKNHFLQSLILVFSLGLELRYVPYMATGNYFGITPILRNVLMILPVAMFLFYWVVKTRILK